MWFRLFAALLLLSPFAAIAQEEGHAPKVLKKGAKAPGEESGGGTKKKLEKPKPKDGDAKPESHGKDGEKPAGDAKDGGTDSGAPGGANAMKPLAGDVISMKNGKVLTGVQVLRETAGGLDVEITPGAPPLSVPRKLIQSIKYDEIDPMHPEKKPAPAAAPAAAHDTMQGQKLEPAFHDKLTQPLSDEAVTYDNKDLREVFQDLRTRTGLKMMLSNGVRTLPDEKRKWKATIPAKTPVLSVLQDELMKAFPDFRLDWQFDALVVSLNSEPETKPGPAAAPPPAAPGNETVTPSREAPEAKASQEVKSEKAPHFPDGVR